ncbi:unnamed protein product [Caretta caretta]
MASSHVVTSQPQFGIASVARNSWQTDTFDCCSDCKVCACGTFGFCCLGCKVAKDMGECCCCGTSVAMRTLYRTRYRIPGTLLCDCCTAERDGDILARCSCIHLCPRVPYAKVFPSPAVCTVHQSAVVGILISQKRGFCHLADMVMLCECKLLNSAGETRHGLSPSHRCTAPTYCG